MVTVPEKISTNIIDDGVSTIIGHTLVTNSKKWVQTKLYNNTHKYTLRGLYFQIAPFEQAKLIRVLQGSVCCFTFDISRPSPFYLQLYTFDLAPGEDLLVTREYAYGFLTLKSNTLVQVFEDNLQSLDHEGVIPWTKIPMLSKKFKELDNTFSPEKVIVSENDMVLKNITLQ